MLPLFRVYKKVVKFSFTKKEIFWVLIFSIRIWYLAYPTDRSFVKKTHIIVNSIIQKLKSKPTSLKKYTNWRKLNYFSLVLRVQQEKTKQIFRTIAIEGYFRNSKLMSKLWNAFSIRQRLKYFLIKFLMVVQSYFTWFRKFLNKLSIFLHSRNLAKVERRQKGILKKKLK